MQGLQMAVIPEGRKIVFATAFLALTACEGTDLSTVFSNATQPSEGAIETAASAAPREAGTVQVVEAPGDFDVTDTALWDGRPSLGLIWVAYEGADPTNVIIRNEENGQFVVGALYRRERFFPGPPFQLSSDAAAELGILAGSPTTIRVTALREEVVEPVEIVPDPVVADATVEEEAPADIAAPAAASVSAIIDPVDVDPIEAAAAAAIEAAAPLTPGLEPRRPTIEGPNAPLPRRIGSIAPAAETNPAPAEPIAIAVADPIETPRASVSSLDKPFIQIGIFSVRENADRVATNLADAGIIPFVEEQSIGDRKFYRVVVGPASNAAERAALQSSIKAQGFTDAYFVKN